MSKLTSAEASRIKFSTSGTGYNKREVTRLQRQISGTLLVMERNLGEDLPVTAEEVRLAGFSMNIGGYDYEDVDLFLDRSYRIISAYERTRAQKAIAPELMTSEQVAEQGFTVVFRGYHMTSVDRYAARIVDSLEAHETGRLSVSTDAAHVNRKLFDISMRGYAEHQVDAFLDTAAETLRHYEDLRRSHGESSQAMA
jgi:DivIVA domain-containing protein